MKTTKTLLLIIVGFFLLSCDPIQIVYLKNYSEIDLEILVQLSNEYWVDSSLYQIKCKNDLIDEITPSKGFLFDNIINTKTINKQQVTFTIPKLSTSLIEPAFPGYPIEKIIIKNRNADTLILHFDYENINYFIRQGMIERTGFSIFTINYDKLE
ncbi:MAG: hypothetical protein MI922_15855 [Bacteroidales bacterium]|nr:hypothetical protein [Bacteroidales bacterium]